MDKRDEFNRLGITNPEGEHGFNDDVFPVAENEYLHLNFEANQEGEEQFHPLEQFEGTDELGEQATEDRIFGQNMQQLQDATNLSTSTSATTASSATASAATTTAAATTTTAITAVASTAGVIAVAATTVLGVVPLPKALGVEVELLSATRYSLSFYMDIDTEDPEPWTVRLSGEDYEVELPYENVFEFYDLQPTAPYTLAALREGEIQYSANFYTNDDEMPANYIYISLIENSAERLCFSFFDHQMEHHREEEESSTDYLYSIKVTGKSGRTLFAADTGEPYGEFELTPLKEKATIFVSVNSKLRAAYPVGLPEKEPGPNDPIYDYGNVYWGWNDDGSIEEVIFPCTNNQPDYYVYSSNIDVETIAYTAPTCGEQGFAFMRATVTGPDGDLYSDERQFILPTTEHDFGEPEYVWAEDYSECVATVVCRNDESHMLVESGAVSITVLAEPTAAGDGLARYTATFSEPMFETQEIEGPYSGSGLLYNEPMYSWAVDFSSCTAFLECISDPDQSVEETVYVEMYPIYEEGDFGSYLLMIASFSDARFQTQKIPVRIEEGYSYDCSSFTRYTDDDTGEETILASNWDGSPVAHFYASEEALVDGMIHLETGQKLVCNEADFSDFMLALSIVPSNSERELSVSIADSIYQYNIDAETEYCEIITEESSVLGNFPLEIINTGLESIDIVAMFFTGSGITYTELNYSFEYSWDDRMNACFATATPSDETSPTLEVAAHVYWDRISEPEEGKPGVMRCTATFDHPLFETQVQDVSFTENEQFYSFATFSGDKGRFLTFAEAEDGGWEMAFLCNDAVTFEDPGYQVPITFGPQGALCNESNFPGRIESVTINFEEDSIDYQNILIIFDIMPFDEPTYVSSAFPCTSFTSNSVTFDVAALAEQDAAPSAPYHFNLCNNTGSTFTITSIDVSCATMIVV